MPMTPNETKHWLPRPKGDEKSFADLLGGHNTSIELAIFEDVTHPGLIQFLIERDTYSKWKSSSKGGFKQTFIEVNSYDPFAVYAPLESSECIGMSHGMRLLINRTAHLSTLLMTTGKEAEIADNDIRLLIERVLNRDYGVQKSKDFAGYDLIRRPWEDSDFEYEFNSSSADEYHYLCSVLTYFVLDHERNHALSGDGGIIGFERSGQYIGDVKSNVGTEEALRELNWCLELSADWHGVIKILVNLQNEAFRNVLTMGNQYYCNPKRMIAAFLLGVALLIQLLYLDTWLKLNKEIFGLFFVEKEPQKLFSEDAILKAVKSKQEDLALMHPYGHFRMLGVLFAITSSGAATYLGKEFPYEIVEFPLHCLTRLALIEAHFKKSLGTMGVSPSHYTHLHKS
ncbi:hypothetical protein ThidrDRAFT_0002 [Thiorhodococcus drewsii AZ1]|uniref:Uncharacterized protein n=1 Tax=Thiorhodococcus drewsii AZ1 TaxID=765913 RepID=G2DVU1_9GAMM|nr:hypothetical protein [Thiorhodococcus drewsii]EGV33847.1 hypothetical protein ThidrDRAFT_0002 [Thiorhodococcus drewsii AZ1]